MLQNRFVLLLCLFTVMIVFYSVPVQGEELETDPAFIAEKIRSSLVELQFLITSDQNQANQQLQEIKQLYYKQLADQISEADQKLHQNINDYFHQAEHAIEDQNTTLFAQTRAQIWTNLLAGGVAVVEKAITSNNASQAQKWLRLREYRKTTRITRPNTDATNAVEQFYGKKLSAQMTLDAIHSDLLDTYQAKMQETLEELKDQSDKGFQMRSAESASLAEGYFAILSESYRKQLGAQQLNKINRHFTDLKNRIQTKQDPLPVIKKIELSLKGFRAAPLTLEEKKRRAGQLQRFLALIPIEYGRGVSGGKVTKDIEIMEAITFYDGAIAAFRDLESDITKRNPKKVEQMGRILDQLYQGLSAARKQTQVVEPEKIEDQVQQLQKISNQVLPSEWLKRSTESDFDAIDDALDRMEKEIVKKQFEIAETTRLEAYAIMDTGPEGKLVAFAPQFIPQIEDLFWYGSGEYKGLAKLIQEKASIDEVKRTRTKLDQILKESQSALGGSNSSLAITTNAAIIVFREGLEAVLIIAALMAGFHRSEHRHLRQPLGWGAVASVFATILTWFLAQGIINSLAQYGEKLEAIISLIAVILLLLITNWFFHKSYWTDWLKSFQTKKWKLKDHGLGQWIGMFLLGFDSIYREGFETVLFLQALVLDGGTKPVLLGVAIGAIGIILIGIIIFQIQIKLPYKKMLIITGFLIVSVLVTMVGSTVHSFQLVGWLSLNPIRGLELPYWSSLWLGTYATWEGIILQISSAIFVFGSYFLATWLNKRSFEKKKHRLQQPKSLNDKEVVS